LAWSFSSFASNRIESLQITVQTGTRTGTKKPLKYADFLSAELRVHDENRFVWVRLWVEIDIPEDARTTTSYMGTGLDE
jgi:hypothetical protein